MALCNLFDSVVDTRGNALSGTVTVTIDGGASASLFLDEAGSTPAANPYTFTNGTINLWVAAGRLDLAITSGATTITKTVDLAQMTGTGSLQFGTDTRLLRGGAGILRTDNTFQAAADLVARHDDELAKVTMGLVGANPGIVFGTGADTNLYRSAADTLKTDDGFTAASVSTAGNVTLTGGAGALIQRSATNGTISVFAARAAASTVDSIRITASGDIAWSDGSAASDTTLLRGGVGVLRTNNIFQAAGELVARHDDEIIKMAMGSVGGYAGLTFGTAGDTNLFRFAPDHLRTNDLFSVTRPTDNTAFALQLDASTTANFGITAGGAVSWGDGTAARDTNLYRSAANVLKTDDGFHVGSAYTEAIGGGVGASISTLGAFRATRAAATSGGLFLGAPGNTFDRFEIRCDGTQLWGDGVAALDTNLYRSAANVLKTDDSLHVGNFSSTNAVLQVHPVGAAADSGYISMVNSRARFGYDGAAVRVDDNATSKPIRFYTAGALAAEISTAGAFSLVGSFAHQGANLGFFNTAVTTKKTVTGARGGNAALASLLTQLASYGLITDSTSA